MEYDKLIWKYLDNKCTQDELIVVNGLKADPIFNTELLRCQEIHNSLNVLPRITAPEGLIQNTLNRLSKIDEKSKMNIPSIDYRPLLIFLTTLTVACIVCFIIPMRSHYFIPLQIEIPSFSYIDLDISWLFSDQLKYLLYALIVFPFLGIIDKWMVANHNISYAKMNNRQ